MTEDLDQLARKLAPAIAAELDARRTVDEATHAEHHDYIRTCIARDKRRDELVQGVKKHALLWVVGGLLIGLWQLFVYWWSISRAGVVMAVDMTRKSLVDSFKASLQDAAQYFTASADGDFIRLLDIAALDMSRVRPLVLRDSVTLVAGTLDYPAPGGIVRVTRTAWGRAAQKARKPWDAGYPNQLPHLRMVETASGAVLELSREVTDSEIADLGADCVYYYEAAHAIGDLAADTTIKAADRGLLILRAQAEACGELALRGVGKPVRVNDGYSGVARNANPAALAENFLNAWLKQAGCIAA